MRAGRNNEGKGIPAVAPMSFRLCLRKKDRLRSETSGTQTSLFTKQAEFGKNLGDENSTQPLLGL